MTAGVLASFFGLRSASTIRPKDRKEQKQIRYINGSVQVDITGALGQRDTLSFRFTPLRSRPTVKRWIDFIIVIHTILVRVVSLDSKAICDV